MTQHIIDTDKLDKLPKYTWSDVGPVPCNRGDYVHIDDLLALIANSPQADGINATREELDRFLRDMRDVKPNPKAQETLSKGRAILRQMEAQADGMVLDVINQCAKIAEKYEPEEKLDYIDYASKEIKMLLSAYKPQAEKAIDPSVERALCESDATIYGRGYMLNGERIPPQDLLIFDNQNTRTKQADDGRKDAEREWAPKFPVGSKVVFYQKHPESPLNKEPTSGTVESYYDWNTAECGEHYTIKMAVVDVDGVKIKVEHNCLLAIDKARE